MGNEGGTSPLSPLAPQSYDPMTHRIGIPDVADQELQEYMRIAQEPNEALKLARMDKIWLQVAKEYGILTGDKKRDHLLWQDHHLFMQGAINEDPIMHSDAARDEFFRRVIERMGVSTDVSG